MSTTCFIMSLLQTGEQAGASGVSSESPHPLPVVLNTSVVDDRLEATIQNEEDYQEDISVFTVAWHKAQEDEGL